MVVVCYITTKVRGVTRLELAETMGIAHLLNGEAPAMNYGKI